MFLYDFLSFFILTKTVQQSMIEEDSFDSSDSQYDTDKEIEKNIYAISEKTKESKGQSFKKWATEQMGIKLKDNQNKSTEDESNIISQVRRKDIEKKVLIQDGIDITVESISDDEKTKESVETKTVKKVFKNILNFLIVASFIGKSSHFRIPFKAFYVSVERNQEIQEARLKLPICDEEQTIMEAI